jgi:hypothetical protein
MQQHASTVRLELDRIVGSGEHSGPEGEIGRLGDGQIQGRGLTLALAILCGPPQHTRPKGLKTRD